MKISERILHEAGIANRFGQYERLIQIAYKVEKLEAIAKRVEGAPTAMVIRHAHIGPLVLISDELLVGKRVAIVPIEEDTP